MQLRLLRRLSPLLAATATALALSACTAAAPPSEPATPSAAPLEAEGAFAEPGTAATWDQPSADAAAQAATTAMALFVSHPDDAQVWWAQLQPLLSTTAARDYVGVDPANVPARRVTGPSLVEQDASAYLAAAVVPTDHGAYTVLLSRQGGDQPWLVESLTPPPSASSAARS
ncbi:hypothetical protein [Quadrisphaera sp. INWT6]|uniref:hypothetical protein n=1 Tax=Quadrisphaera sp. INWT6 TaxID=2596917 RepID=UPI001892866E|nr:hypothetical protein [Quadrisphaera sp. INWT6]MBF5083765.1 hypothetical protein [Quadrisphaera sp. INWT6]